MQIWLIHVAFHTFWAVIFLISLSGVFALIPLIGSYVSFVLGFLGSSVLASVTRGISLGFIVFSVTGLLSGWFISVFRPRSAWIPGLLSLCASIALLGSATWIRYTYFGVADLESVLPLPVSTGIPQHEALASALKSAYHSAGDVPPYLPGKEATIPLAQLQIAANNLTAQHASMVYCNLPPQIWRALRKAGGTSTYPLAWSDMVDATGKRLVISVNFYTDIFNNEFLSEEEFAQKISETQADVRAKAGDREFMLRH